MHRMSDRAAFGSMVASDWQQLPVRPLSCLTEAVQSPSLGWSAGKPHASCDEHARKMYCRSDAYTYGAEAGPMNDGTAGH